VYLAASAEAHSIALRAMSRGVPVGTAMMTQYATLTPEADVEDAVQTLLRTSQSEFPVVDAAGKPVGLLARADIIRALKERGPDAKVARRRHVAGAGGRPPPLPRRGVPHPAGEVGAGGRGSRHERPAGWARHLGNDRRDDAPAPGASQGRALGALEPAGEPLAHDPEKWIPVFGKACPRA